MQRRCNRTTKCGLKLYDRKIKFNITILSMLAFVCLNHACFCVLKSKFLISLELFFENIFQFLGSQTQKVITVS